MKTTITNIFAQVKDIVRGQLTSMLTFQTVAGCHLVHGWAI